MDLNALAAGFVVLLFLGWLWWDRRGAAEGAEAKLRGICSGDTQQVERLIAFEIARASAPISRAEAAQRAVARHRRDNR